MTYFGKGVDATEKFGVVFPVGDTLRYRVVGPDKIEDMDIGECPVVAVPSDTMTVFPMSNPTQLAYVPPDYRPAPNSPNFAHFVKASVHPEFTHALLVAHKLSLEANNVGAFWYDDEPSLH